ncbi:sigma-70 family RNA polymerase sigma factor [Lachnospiraceae bacterium ZAX-1]
MADKSTKKGADNINDEEYFEYLLQTYETLIFALCFRTVRNQFDAEDLAQETFLSVYKNLSVFDRQYEKAWICKIASNKCLNFLKNASRRSFPTEDVYFTTIKDKQNTPEEAYLTKESKQGVYEICQQLKEPYKEVAVAHFYKGKSVKEIAQAAGKSTKTIQTQVYRAKAMLKKRWRGAADGR